MSRVAPAGASPAGRLTLQTVLAFMMGVLCFLPKDMQVIAGKGSFNVGAIDAAIMVAAGLAIFRDGKTLRFATRYDKDIILAFLASAMISLLFARMPYYSIKSFFKIFEAVFVYLYFLGVQERQERVVYAGLLVGALITLAVSDPHSSESKMVSSALMLTSVFFLLRGMRPNGLTVNPGGWRLEPILSIVFLAFSFLMYPKKGAIVAYLGCIVMLACFRMIKVRLWNVAALIALGIPALIYISKKAAFTDQFDAVDSFLTGDGEGDTQSLYIRTLQWMVIPSIFKNFLILGYGYSQSRMGIDENLYTYFSNLSMRVFGFQPNSIIMHVGSNFFSDNAYFTLISELGILIFLPAYFVLRALFHYFRTDKLVLIYLCYVIVFSISLVDLVTYRGNGIFFLNALLFGSLAKHVLADSPASDPQAGETADMAAVPLLKPGEGAAA